MQIQDLRRTLADKVFAICDCYFQNNAAKHSRYIYDIYKLTEHISMDEDFRHLIVEVRNVRKAAPICPSAHEIVQKDINKGDYTTLTEQLLEEDISYTTAIQTIIRIADSRIFD